MLAMFYLQILMGVRVALLLMCAICCRLVHSFPTVQLVLEPRSKAAATRYRDAQKIIPTRSICSPDLTGHAPKASAAPRALQWQWFWIVLSIFCWFSINNAASELLNMLQASSHVISSIELVC